jgi:hypothetical protein
LFASPARSAENDSIASSSGDDPTPGSVSFPVEADARVEQAYPLENFGARSSIRVDGATNSFEYTKVDSYLSFDVRGLPGPVATAKLLVHATSQTVDGPNVRVASNLWTESTITWLTRPVSGAPIADADAVASGTWLEYDVTTAVTADGVYSFRLTSYSNDGISFSSRESGLGARLVVTPSGAPPPPPPLPPPGACARFASVSGSDGNVGSLVSPFRSPQRLADSLAAGETGCLRGGVYDNGATYVVRFGRGGSAGAPITIRSYPGERARLVGIVYVPRGSNHVTLAAVDVEGRGSQNTVQVNAEDFTLEDSDLTNAWRGNSCLMLGDPGYGRAVRTIVRRNRFHECGNLSHGNKDHAIYAGYVSDAQIVDNLFWNSAAYAIQLYPDAQRTRFAHNVIDGDSPSVRGGLIFGGEGSYASSNNTVEQNIITYATVNIEYWWGGTIGSGNIARNNCLWAGRSGNISSQVGFTASNNLTADPLFTNKATRDYRLKAGSPCLPLIGHDTAAALLRLLGGQ